MNSKSAANSGTSVASLLDRGMRELAFAQARTDVEQAPNDPKAWHQLGSVLSKMRDFLGAKEAYEQGLRVEPGALPLLVELAIATLENGEVDEALALTRRLRGSLPGHPWPLIHEAIAHLRRNRFAEAEAALLEVAEDQRHQIDWVLQMAIVLTERKAWGEADDLLRRMIESPATNKNGKAYAWFQIAKLREKQKDYDGAWEAARTAHDTLNQPISAARFLREAEAIREVMHRGALQGWSRATQDFEQSVLIVGMPRSGTSLLEQILSMHPDVANAGELAVAGAIQHRLPIVTDSFLPWPRSIADMRDADADVLQAMYRREVERIGAGRKRITDKSLLLVYQIGLLSRVLPGARSIMLRRHPLDNIVSCYTTHLACVGHTYTNDLKTLAEVWKIRDELQDFWMENLDPVPLDLHYERLVADQEAETRRLIDYLDIPWTDDCLRFHESTRVARTISFDQVNQKMYTTSVERWRRYEKHLGPAIEVLGL